MTYAIISLGGKQYRVQEGEKLLVDRVATDEGKTFHPSILLVGGNGETSLDGNGATVTVRVVGHVLGKKIRIGKYRPKSGFRKHTGFRAKLSQIEIESIAAGRRAATTPAAKETEQKTPEAAQAPTGLPTGYADMTVAQISDGVKSWKPAEVEAALAYERDHAKRKGALAALESAAEREEV
jgi:large subunit ribosomal protein L21